MLDMDSSVSPTHGEQENSVWNGHYACTCYHPLFVLNPVTWNDVRFVPATSTANLTAADICDSAGAQPILDAIRKCWPWVKHLFRGRHL